ncbi:MAG: SDR family oxidoreductase, partial [Armatimonadetes bacterium]|nr:SDR family oxidoreductase [Armatimonadota bacterium]
ATVRECFGPISILVNNAGITSRLGLSDITDEHWDDVMSTNVKGLLYACQAVVGDMKAARWGRILNCSSYGARHSRIERGVYSASKAALNALTQIWAGELGSYGITVNAYAPGDMKTEMMADVLATPAGAALTRNIVLGRLGEPEEVADVVLYLASERASYLTGAIIEVTGGKFVVQNPHDAWPTPP